jgi:hypothetical protein
VPSQQDPNIQAAIDTATDGDIIVVADGIWPQNATDSGFYNIDFKGKAITVKSLNGADHCTISCARLGRGFYFHNGEDTDSVVDGFTIWRGSADFGGAIECEQASPTITNCVFFDNIAQQEGGAIDCYDAAPIIANCIFLENSAHDFGAAIECYMSSPIIQNCLSAYSHTSTGTGGAIDCYNSDAIIKNCSFVRSLNAYSDIGVNASGSPVPDITNCIFWFNQDDLQGCSATFSCIQGGDPGTGNISSDPLFRTGPYGGSVGQYYLSSIAAGQLANSPCIDAGVGTAAAFIDPNCFTTRTDSIADDGLVDMGFHYPDTGSASQFKLITGVVSGNGTIEPYYPDPGQLYNEFTDVTLHAFPATGYKVKKWKGTNNDPSPKTNTNVVTIATGDNTVTVEFEKLAMYQLTTDVNSATPYGTISPPSGLYQENSFVTITATPQEGYKVLGWNILSSDPNYVTVFMDSPKTVIVTFTNLTSTLTVQVQDANGNPNSSLGTIEPRRGGVYPAGTVVHLKATPVSDAYEIKKWIGTDPSADPNGQNQTVYMNSDKFVAVRFGPRKVYKLTTTIDQSYNNGTINPLGGPFSYYEGTTVVITATPQMGYEVKRYKVNDTWLSPNPDDETHFKITMDSDKTVIFQFDGAVLNQTRGYRYDNIQDAIDEAQRGVVIIVGNGIWTGERNVDLHFYDQQPYSYRPITVRSKSLDPKRCIIDCNGTPLHPHRGFIINNKEDPNFIIDSFTIRNGYVNPNDGFVPDGGGIFIDTNSYPVIKNCIITNNHATRDGGGIFIRTLDNLRKARIISTEITQNSAERRGGGIYCDANSNGAIIDCLITYNYSAAAGGAIYMNNSDPNIYLSTICYNSSDFFQTGSYKGGIYAINSDPNITNCIVGLNDSTAANGNRGWSIGYTFSDDLFGCSATSCCIENDDAGTGNFSEDPSFISGPRGDFYLNQFFEYDQFGNFIGPPPPSMCIDNGELDAYLNYTEDFYIGYLLDKNLTTSILNTPDDRYTDIGYHYKQWTGTPFKYTLTLHVGDTHGIINYLIYDQFQGTYISGIITPATSPQTIEVPPGSRVTITAVPNTNYIVDQWQEFNQKGGYYQTYSTYNVLNLTMTANRTFRVYFEYKHPKTIHVPGSYPYIDIQDALDISRDGDTIVIHPGTYPGTEFVVSRAITITSTDPENPDVVANTIIDCRMDVVSYRGFMLMDIGQGPCVLNGLTIINATIVSMNGTDGTDPGVMGSSTGDVFGGAIQMSGSHTVVNCVIRNCSVQSGEGGNGAAGGILAGPPPTPVPDGGFGGQTGNAGGGGIAIMSGNPHIKNLLIENCLAISGNGGSGGAGADATTRTADPNHPGGRGGDGGNAGFARGGAIYCQRGNPTFENIIIRNCQATGGRGGNGGTGGANAAPTAGWGRITGGRGGDAGVPLPVKGGGICCEAGTTPTFINCSITNNSATGGLGGTGGFSGTDAFNPRRGGLGGLCEYKFIQEVVDAGDYPPQYYGYDPYEYYQLRNPDDFSAFGGGVSCGTWSYSTFKNCTISNNTSTGSLSGRGGSGSGGYGWNAPQRNFDMPSCGSGLYIGKDPFSSITECGITNNRALYNHGADPNFEQLGYGGGICLDGTKIDIANRWGSVSIDGSRIANNITPIGGGIFARGLHSLDIHDSNLMNNLAYGGGGIFAIENESGAISKCTITGNNVDNSVFPENPNPNITEADILGYGAGLYIFTSNIKVSDSEIIDNNATGTGGAVYMGGHPESIPPTYNVNPELFNCLLTNNKAHINGGAVACSWYVNPTITNCTIANNTAGLRGGGLQCTYDSLVKVQNSIFWDNSAANGPQIAVDAGGPVYPLPSTLDISYSDIEGDQPAVFVDTGCTLNWGLGNINQLPIFVAGDMGGYYLSQVDAGQPVTSPCVDSGAGTAAHFGLHKYTTRTDNFPDRRIVDMGYHYPTTIRTPGDLAFDGIIDLADLAILLNYWLEDDCALHDNCEGADFDHDGDVDGRDYAIFAHYYEEDNNYDMIAPSPDPMTWQKTPSASSWSSILMIATTATDDSGVAYYFECTLGPGHDSGWQDSPIYEDTGLPEDTQFKYRVKASDKSVLRNETQWSGEILTYTPPGDVDIFTPKPDPSTWQTEPYEKASFVIRMVATTATDISGPVKYYFDCTSGPGHDSGWQTSPIYEDTVSGDQTTYCYTVKTKDALGNTGQPSVERCVWIDHTAPAPNPSTWQTVPAAASMTSIAMTATPAADPSGVEYFFECTAGGGHPSGWQANNSYTDTGLTSDTQYTYRVRTRDKSANNNTGNWSTSQSATTFVDSTAPQPNPSQWAPGGEPHAIAGQYKITMTAQTATDESGVEYSFECTAGGEHSSGWQDSSTYTDIGLSANIVYTYRVKTRDKSISHNESGYSTAKSDMIDFTPPTPNPSEWLVAPYEYHIGGQYYHKMTAKTATDVGGLNPANVEYYFYCYNSASSGWQADPVYNVPVSGPGLLWSYKVKTRDKSSNHNETAYSSVSVAAPGP